MLKRLRRAVRYRLGLHVVAPQLAEGTDGSVVAYYNSRLSMSSFLEDPDHYERPRVDWILQSVKGGYALEMGCADGGMTALLSPRVDRLLAVDVSEASVRTLANRGLKHVQTRVSLAESFEPAERFDWIVMSEFLEHVRDPATLVRRSLNWLAPGGRLLASSPDGRWEADSIEHLHEFTLASWATLFTGSGVRSARVFRIRDRAGRDRWLGADVSAG
jgi:2-polyprenyl-3-methyl-5-hydroxy-6-metoxy-1,4-benzoquinol methylase